MRSTQNPPVSVAQLLCFDATSLYMDLTKNGSDPIKEMLRDKRLATKLLKGM